MNTDPTTAISLDYLVEFSDDGLEPMSAESAVILIPPTTQDTDATHQGAPEPSPNA